MYSFMKIVFKTDNFHILKTFSIMVANISHLLKLRYKKW